MRVTNYIGNVLIQFYFRNLPFVGKSSFTCMREIEIVIVNTLMRNKVSKTTKLSVCLQLTPYKVNHKNFTSSRNDER